MVNRAIIRDIEDGGYPNLIAVAYFMDDTTNAVVASNIAFFSLTGVTTTDQYTAAAVTSVTALATSLGYSLPAGIIWDSLSTAQINALIAAAIPAAPSSYQTIVSQTGTAAPAVSGGFTPANTYSGSPTFTWARSSAGVYTLTASAAIFNTSGKTGVFVAPLQNLNASIKAVVTSSTVITITTAVQSVAVLGLLGLTATATDALLTQTMVYIQTYA